MKTQVRRRARLLPFVVLPCAAMALTMFATGGIAGAKVPSAATLANLKVTAANVTVKAKGSSDFVAAKNGQALKQGDTVKTDADGRAEIDYTDGSLTRLSGSTVFNISKLTNERGGRQTQGTLLVGEAWNRAAKVSETGSFELKAGGTTAAVEGTAFVGKCVPKDSGKQEVSCSFTAVVDDIKVSSDDWDVTSVTKAP